MRALVFAVMLVLFAGPVRADDQAARQFEERIRPLLVDRCFKCHSGDQAKGGLRLDSAEALSKGGTSGPVVAAGKPDESLLIQAVRHEGDLKMPPKEKLPAEQIEALVTWVKAGAVWPASAPPTTAMQPLPWSFQPVKPVEIPAGDPAWSDHPIDRFIAARWMEHGLHAVPAADGRTLLRRVTFDLTGLPPTPEEAHAFLADGASDAFARLVQRLLDSPRYGERWGRHWMDVVRYADTAGDNADYPVPEAGLYRDWIIDVFNADQPYDQFLREQIAGDLLAKDGLPERFREQVIATTFLGLSRRYATGPYELWPLTLEDTIDTIGQGMLGLTLRCARCHDHKYDPVTMRDYYGLYGIFDSTQFPWAGAEEFASKSTPRREFAPLLPEAEAQSRLAAWRARLEELQTQILEEKDQNKIGALKTELRNLERPGGPSDVPLAYAVRDGSPRDAPIQLRGEASRPGPVVPRGAIAAVSNGKPLDIPAGQSGRRQLAEWITRPDHPLTARVMVNRIWQHHFGQGLVATPSNFGNRGAPPSHPELLDWLAAEFVKSGWSVKAMHRLIVSSKTWQLSSAVDEANSARDPANRFCWRHDRQRLEAESIRDALLAVSGKLDVGRPGPHPFPPIKEWGFTQHNQFKTFYPSDHRSVYLMTPRLQRHPFLALFDGPDTNTTTGTRTSATVPLQALYLMNSPEVRAQAEAFAGRLLGASSDDAERIGLAYELCYARPRTKPEFDLGVAFLTQARETLQAAGTPANQLPKEVWTSYARILLTANEFFYID